MSNFKKILAILLALVMLVPMLAACGKGDDPTVDPDDVIQEETIGIVPPEVDFGGEDFTILCRESNSWGSWEDEIHSDEQETEVVNQAVYERNLAVSEALGVEIKVIPIPGHWTDAETFTNTFKNSILSGDGAFDIIVAQQAYMATLANAELYMNMYDVPYVKDDLDSPYFYQDLVNELTVNGKLNYLIGDYTITYMDNINVMYFNKQIAENENLDDIYQTVRDGNWTIDKCIELSKGVYNDLDGNGYKSENDRFGYITDYGNTADGLFSQFDVQQTRKDDSGNIVADMDVGKVVSILETMIEFYKTDDVFTYASSSDQTPEDMPFNTIFTEDRALFYPDVLSTAKTYRGMETDFGIIPVPKWEGQEKYYTQAQAGYSVVVIPIDAPDLEKAGAVIDALFAKSEELVIPAYYDMALKGKFARDNESGEMIDIIREGLCINFGFFYDVGGGSMFRVLLGGENSNFASFYAANKKGYERNLKTILKTFEDDEEEE
ncbi:MAG: carbohydrate ABC transporter substrate-binding protein [Clostridia bacterium]|nr:carbohydrate ABC transporter substrate-binding protein [Clostridia bacterium]